MFFSAHKGLSNLSQETVRQAVYGYIHSQAAVQYLL